MVLEFHELEYHQKIFSKFEDYLKKKKLEFLELEFHGKLNFHKLEFQKSDKSLHIFKTIVHC